MNPLSAWLGNMAIADVPLTGIAVDTAITHVGRAVVYMATLPLDANVQFMTVMATKMPYIGRG